MTFRRAIKRLRLQPGDIILAHRSIPWDAFKNCSHEVKHSVRIIYFENKNDIRRMGFEELEEIYLEAKKVKDGGLQSSGI